MYWGIAHLFLIFNVVVSLTFFPRWNARDFDTVGSDNQAMAGGSYGVIAKKQPEIAVGALLAVVVLQGMYCLRVAASCESHFAIDNHRTRLRSNL